MTALELLKDYSPCGEAAEWLNDRSPKQAWLECERGDWLLWAAAKIGVDRKLVVLAACRCARDALQFVPDGEPRPLKAIEIAEAWARGEATPIAATRASAARAAAAADAAYAAYAAADAAAAYAAAAAAAAYAAAAYAAYAAAYAAAAYAGDAAAAAAYGATRTQRLLAYADWVRETMPWAEVAKAIVACEEVQT